jgi:hypothetical protein
MRKPAAKFTKDENACCCLSVSMMCLAGALFNILHWTDSEMEQIVLQRPETAETERERERKR